MKPAPFEHAAPSTLEDALILLEHGQPNAKVLAGGQSLMPILNFRLAAPALLVDLNRIADLAGISELEDGGLRIGALTRTRDLELSPLVRARQPLLAAAVPHIAHVPIRNRGTIGGSLCHADPASELPAVVTALDAELEIVRWGGRRSLAPGAFFRGVYATDLRADEIPTAIHLPVWPASRAWAFAEISRRRGDFAIVGCAFWADRDAGGLVMAARFTFFGVADRAQSVAEAAAALVGHPLDDAGAIGAAQAAIAAALAPDDDLHASARYRKEMAVELARRAVAEAAARRGAEHG